MPVTQHSWVHTNSMLHLSVIYFDISCYVRSRANGTTYSTILMSCTYYIICGGRYYTIDTTDCDWAVARKFDAGTAVFDTGSTSWRDGRVLEALVI